MTRGIYTKWIVGGIVLLIIVAGACLLWYRHDTAAGRKEAAEAEKVLQQWKANKEPQPTIKAETESTDTPAENTTSTAEKPTTIIGEGTETNTDKTSKTVNIATPEQDNIEEVKVSPHGFGPYPEVPEDFLENVNWANYENDRPIFELMLRVHIKLWKQGHRAEGISKDGELLYPIIRGIVYIRWSGNGDDKYIGRVTGHPKDDLSYDVIKQIEAGTIPAGLTVYEKDKMGIDPYKFLNLQRVPGN